MFDHPELKLERVEAGEFHLVGGSPEPIRVSSDGTGWRISGHGDLEGWILRRGGTSRAGFVLLERGGCEEAGRTCALQGLGLAADLYYLLLGDGRLFRIVAPRLRDPVVELRGWETDGAYLVARPEPEGWRFLPTPACGGLSDVRAISILLAAEILDSEMPLR